jgi:uncharacterized phiE125 gp8 family phage protein
MLAPVRTVAPTGTLVTLSEAKLHCRIDGGDEDLLVSGLVKAAQDHLDGYSGVLGRALLTQTWRQDFDAFSDTMRLPVGNLLAVSSVTYYDASNAQQTLASSVYTAFSDTLGPYVTRKPGQAWPSTYTRPDAVSVTWTAGYGPAATDVPSSIRQAVLLLVGHWYANREAVTSDPAAPLPFAVDALLSPLRRLTT